jgi:DNA recombination protein RmuC
MEPATLLLAALIVIVLSVAWRVFRLERVLQEAREAPAGLELLQREVQAMRSGVDERLREHVQQTHELSARIGRLQRATEQVEQLGVGLDELQKVLQPPQLRGAFGERLLQDMLSDVLPREAFCLQYTYPSSGVRVDAAVLLGQGRILPIDAKFPLDNFRRFIDCRRAGSPDADGALREFARDVTRHVDDIATKYLSPEDGALDVAFMYIPSESVFQEISLSGVDAGGQALAEYSLRKRVVPVSPNSLHAYLCVVRMGLKGYQLQKSAREILGALTQLQSDLEESQTGLATAIKQSRHSLANLEEVERVLGRSMMRLDVLGQPLVEPPENSPPGPGAT